MKKRHAAFAGLLGLIAGQAITIYSKDKKLRKDMAEKEGLLGKGKVFWDKWLSTNKQIVEEVANTDRQETATTIREGAKHDTENVKNRIEEKKNTDRKAEGKEAMENILEKTQAKEKIQDVKEKVSNRWDDLKENFSEKAGEIEEKFEKETTKAREKIADKIDETAENMKSKIQPKKDE